MPSTNPALQEQARQLRKKYGSYRKASQVTGIKAGTLRDRATGGRSGRSQGGGIPPAAACPASPAVLKGKSGLSKLEFLRRFDPNTRTRTQLQEAVRLIEKARFYADHELRRMVGCGDPKLWRTLASDPAEGFTDHQFSIAGIIYWSDKASVSEIISSNSKAHRIGE